MKDYSIIFNKPYEEMSEEEIDSLTEELKRRFLNFFADRCKGFTLLEAILEYSEKYSLDERILGELIQRDRELTMSLKPLAKNSKTSQIKEDW